MVADPVFRLKDGVGITYPVNNFTFVDGSEDLRYAYERWTGHAGSYVSTVTTTKRTAETKAANKGIGILLDLKANDNNYYLRNHRGSFSIDVLLANNSVINGNAFGHYGHTELNFIGGVGVSIGGDKSFTITGASKVTYMPDAAVTFSTR